MDAFEAAMAALADRFRERCARESVELQALIDGGELYSSEARRLLHGLAGTGGSFGFDEISTMSRKVELALEDHAVEPADLTHLFAALAACEQTAPD
jgi:HPt (histidine-containing phosphotransfer) domain-containing protein